eukprot:7254742-Prymnesium_polylepis.1
MEVDQAHESVKQAREEAAQAMRDLRMQHAEQLADAEAAAGSARAEARPRHGPPLAMQRVTHCKGHHTLDLPCS